MGMGAVGLCGRFICGEGVLQLRHFNRDRIAPCPVRPIRHAAAYNHYNEACSPVNIISSARKL